jgi:dolichyl-phosphate beta-glucosyltransferase
MTVYGDKVSVIIPAFNEEAMIGVTLAEVRDYFASRNIDFEVVVVVEGSDRTASIAREMAGADARIRVIASQGRRGKGAAVREGVLAATGDVIGYIDADGKTPIAELDRVLPWLRTFHLVIGSRATEGARIVRWPRWYRRAGSRVFAVYLHALLGLVQIPDTQCGLKFFRREVARDLFGDLTIRGYVFDVEILYRSIRRGYAVQQVGVRWADDGDSRLDLVRGNARNFFDILGLALRCGLRRVAVRDERLVAPSALNPTDR